MVIGIGGGGVGFWGFEIRDLESGAFGDLEGKFG